MPPIARPRGNSMASLREWNDERQAPTPPWPASALKADAPLFASTKAASW